MSNHKKNSTQMTLIDLIDMMFMRGIKNLMNLMTISVISVICVLFGSETSLAFWFWISLVLPLRLFEKYDAN